MHFPCQIRFSGTNTAPSFPEEPIPQALLEISDRKTAHTRCRSPGGGHSMHHNDPRQARMWCRRSTGKLKGRHGFPDLPQQASKAPWRIVAAGNPGKRTYDGKPRQSVAHGHCRAGQSLFQECPGVNSAVSRGRRPPFTTSVTSRATVARGCCPIRRCTARAPMQSVCRSRLPRTKPRRTASTCWPVIRPAPYLEKVPREWRHTANE